MSEEKNTTQMEEADFITVTDANGAETNYKIEDSFELTFKGEQRSYMVLIKEEEASASRFSPLVVRYHANDDSVETIMDPDELREVGKIVEEMFEQDS